MRRVNGIDMFDTGDVIRAFEDALEGNSSYHDIQYNTGLPEERCKEIEAIYKAVTEQKIVNTNSP